MEGDNKKYKNFFNRVFLSFFSSHFYQFVATKQKNNGFSTLVVLLFITFFIPSFIISNKLKNFSFESSDPKIIELKEIINEVPNFIIEGGELNNENLDQIPLNIGFSLLDKNFITIDAEKNSLTSSNSVILFSKDGVYISNVEVISLLFRILGVREFPTGQLQSINESFANYPSEKPIEISSDSFYEWGMAYIKYLSSALLYSVFPLIFIMSLIFKLIEILVMSFVTKVFVSIYQINLNYRQIFRLTIVALIPSTVIKMINFASLWQSNILANNTVSSILIFAINIYFISFAVKSCKKPT